MSSEIDAARIAADAAIQAAWIQGGWTFAAGIAAFVGGLLALWGAYLAATRQVRLAERTQAARVSAYRFRIKTILADLTSSSAVYFVEATILLKKHRKDPTTPMDMIHPRPLADLLSEEHWEDHALLGQEAVQAIHDIRVRLKEYEDFCHEVSQENLQGNDFPQRHFREKRPGVENADGGMTFQRYDVVATNKILAREVRDAVARLSAALNRSAE